MPETKRPPARSASPARKTGSAPARRASTPRAASTRGRRSSSAKAVAPARPRKSSGRGRSSAASPFAGLGRISPERRLDILGVGMVLVGLLTVLGLVTPVPSTGIGAWIVLVSRVAGWGSIVLPVTLMLVGVWLVLRNVERLPLLSAERMTGLVLLYLNILAWMHLLGPRFAEGLSGWELAAASKGGGYIGGLFEQITVAALGLPGAYVMFAAWSLIALALTLDVSVSELFHFFQSALASLARRANRRLTEGQGGAFAGGRANGNGHIIPELGPDGQPRDGALSSELPPSFQPMHTQPMPPRPGFTSPASGAGAANSTGAANSVGAASSPALTNPARPRSTKADAAGSSGAAATADPGQTQASPQPSFAAKTTPLPPWKLPPVADILEAAEPASSTAGKEEEARRSQLIEETLASFGAPVKVVKISSGPTVTQFGVEPQFIESRSGTRTRVRVSKIVALADDLALALAAPRIRIQAPVPGRAYVGIEVPNLEISRVTIRDVMESEQFRKLKSPMRFALGKDVAGQPKAYDLASMPHLLIAGTTGSGKSVLVNALLSCLLLNNTPNELRMILVDPKRVELTGYNGIPHLLAPVVVEADQVVGALQWVQREMDARYHRFSQVGSRNIVDYNARNYPPLPYMLVLIDELADLMMLAPDETERSLTRLAQLARATGIHLVLATQRPSVNVVTGLIKANFPARVAFAVASGIDSRVILDQPGAERLLGRGDMLFQAPDAAAPVRLQGVYVSDAEIQDLVEYWRQQAYELRNVNLHTPTATPVNMDLPTNAPLKQASLFEGENGKGADPIVAEAIKIVRAEGKASISMLQRKMRIGYTRAARLMDQLEEMGIVGPAQATSQMREVLDYGEDAGAADADMDEDLDGEEDE